MNPSFAQRIASMNAMYRLPAHERPTLPDDPADRLTKFKATLPEDRQVNFSAMVYQNAGSILAPAAKIVSGVADANAPKGVRKTIKQLLGGKAGLAYVYALNDRMIMSVNSEDGPVGLSPSDLLGLPGSSGLGHIIGGIAR